jgi:nucleotide-binding universal stress UspA family protein
MYTKILVPMDGSEIAERVLPTVEWFAKVSKVKEIVIVRVVEPLQMRDDLELHLDPDEKKRIKKDSYQLAEAYCEEITARLKSKKVKYTGKILEGKTAKAIIDYITKDKDIDLIIMATHARSEFGKLLHGSVTDDVVHDAVVPVLLVTPHGREPT